MVTEELISIPERAREMGARRLKVLEMLSHGWTNVEIGMELSVSATSVKRDIQYLRVHFGARNCTHLVAIAYERGISGGKVEDAGSKTG